MYIRSSLFDDDNHSTLGELRKPFCEGITTHGTKCAMFLFLFDFMNLKSYNFDRFCGLVRLPVGCGCLYVFLPILVFVYVHIVYIFILIHYPFTGKKKKEFEKVQ